MTALDFPSSPTNGQVYGDYTYDGTTGVWRATTLQPVVATVSDIPPSNPKGGDTWVYAAEGTMFVYYVDGTSSQWIEVRQNATETSGAFTGAVSVGGTLTVGDSTSLTAISASSTPLTVTGVSGQTANLQSWKNSAGTVVADVDNVGRVTFGTNVMPAFHAVGLTTQAWSGTAVWTKLSLLSAVTNSGSHYDAVTNARFTAPIAGLYYFYATFVQSTAVGGPEAKFYKNGAAVANVAIGYTTAYHTTGGAVILSLAANDYVEIYLQNNNATTVTIDRARCSFGGRLIG